MSVHSSAPDVNNFIYRIYSGSRRNIPDPCCKSSHEPVSSADIRPLAIELSEAHAECAGSKLQCSLFAKHVKTDVQRVQRRAKAPLYIPFSSPRSRSRFLLWPPLDSNGRMLHADILPNRTRGFVFDSRALIRYLAPVWMPPIVMLSAL